MKLSNSQCEALKVLRKYPNEIIMNDGWITGGHGIRFNLKTIGSLINKGLIEHKWAGIRLSELGKTAELC